MSSQVQALFNATIAATLSSAIGTLGTSQFPFTQSIQYALANGTAAAKKANQALFLTGTIATGAHVDIDLYANSAAVDAVGNAVTMTALKFLFIQNLGSATPVEADVLTVGGTTATTAFTSLLGTNADLIKLPGPLTAAGNSFIILANDGLVAWLVGNASTNHLLRLSSTGPSTITYNLVAIGSVN